MSRFKFALTDKHLVLKNQDEISNFSIFNSSKFIKLHNENRSVTSFSLHLKSSLQCLGVCHFSKGRHGLFQSPCIGSFGGFEFLDSVSLELKELFLLSITSSFSPCTHIATLFAWAIYRDEMDLLILFT